MAISFTKSITEAGIVNAFNDNVVEFSSSSLSPATKATITVNSTDFVITPDSNGVFTYNFLTLFRTLVNQNNFADGVMSEAAGINPVSPDYGIQDSDAYQDITVDYEVTLESGGTETVSKTYRVLRSLVQLEEYRKGLTNQGNSLIALLLPFYDSSMHFHATYFEGYPFDIPVYSNDARNLIITHKGTGNSTSIAIEKGVNRIFVSNGTSNWSFEDVLPLHTGVNELQFTYIGYATEKTLTLFLTKKQGLCGTFLKWLNQSGGWSYYLFNHFKTERKTKSLGEIYNGGKNLAESTEEEVSIGTSSQDTSTLFFTAATPEEKNLINSIFDSPKIYRLLNDPFANAEESDWIPEKIKDSTYEISNKNKVIYEDSFQLLKSERYKMSL